MASLSQLQRTAGDSSLFTHRPFTQVWAADGINDYLSFENSTAVQDLLFNRLGQNNRFTISCWANPLVNVGGQYIFLNINNTSRTLLSGDWNGLSTNPYTLLYGGISQNSGVQGWQTLGPGRAGNDFIGLIGSGFSNRLCHFAWVNAGAGAERFRVYVNGRLWPKSTGLTTLVNYNQANTNSFITLCMYSYNSTPLVFIPLRLTDFMIATVAATDQEIRQVFYNGTNQPSEYASKYPTNLLNNRWVHLPLSLGNFTVAGPDLFANDISGNNRNFRVLGQGTTPNFAPAY